MERTETQRKILEIGKREFLEKGFMKMETGVFMTVDGRLAAKPVHGLLLRKWSAGGTAVLFPEYTSRCHGQWAIRDVYASSPRNLSYLDTTSLPPY